MNGARPNCGNIQEMLEQADRLAERARVGRWKALQACQDAWLMRASISTQIEEFGKEQGFRRRYVAAMLPMILSGAIDHARAEMGNIQIRDTGGSLKICTQQGFHREFLEFFSGGKGGQTACSLAFRNAEVVVVRDVTESNVFDCASAVEALLDAGVRSVQSIPLFSRSGRVLGVLSTHGNRVKHPSASELKRIKHFARWAGTLLEWRERGTTIGYPKA
jgi:GAF domain-containing protein